MFTKKWWGKTVDRVAKTAAYCLITFVGTDQLGFKSLDWGFIWYTTAVMMLLSFAGAILTTNVGPDHDDPSVL